MPPMRQGADLPRSLVAYLPGHVRAVSGVRPEVRARAGLFPRRHVFQLPDFDSSSAAAGSGDLVAHALAVRYGAGGGVPCVPSAGARGDPVRARALAAFGPAFRSVGHSLGTCLPVDRLLQAAERSNLARIFREGSRFVEVLFGVGGVAETV